MAYSEHLADRIRQALKDKRIIFGEKNMMGGLAFMVDNKMCLGIIGDELMARIGPEAYEEALKKPVAREMDFTGKPMKGYVFVSPEGIDMDADLDDWIQLCLEFNPQAKASKPRKK